MPITRTTRNTKKKHSQKSEQDEGGGGAGAGAGGGRGMGMGMESRRSGGQGWMDGWTLTQAGGLERSGGTKLEAIGFGWMATSHFSSSSRAGVGGDGGGKARSFLAFFFPSGVWELRAQEAQGRQQDRMIRLGFGI